LPLLFFLLFPFFELYVLLEFAATTSPFWAIGEIVVTGFVGLRLLRGEGISRLRGGLASINGKSEPLFEVVERLFLVIAGALFLMPGFMTDFLGVLVLIAPIRIYMLKTIFSSFFSTRGPNRSHGESASNSEKNRSGTTIEGDFKRRD
jgi:UPF0716 protein FxsA